MRRTLIGDTLRRRRLNAGLSQRELAARIRFHESVITSVERGERAPTQQYLDRFCEALGLLPHEAVELWQIYQEEPRTKERDVRTHSVDCPYRGLFAFRERDAHLYFGREAVVRRLRKKLEFASIIGVVGASGSGKSSVVFAGLIPKLKAERPWIVLEFRPGPRPFAALGNALMDVLSPGMEEIARPHAVNELIVTLREGSLFAAVDQLVRQRKQPLLIFADQFEELYTHSSDYEEVRTFVSALIDVSTSHRGSTTPVKVVLTLRGDFYERVVASRQLSDALQDGIVHLPPMDRAELRRAIVEPAAVRGTHLEDGLVDRILDDVSDEPGKLPLLEFSLMLLWEQQEGGFLTHAAYERIGELAGAIARRAEDVYASFAPEQQDTVRQLLTRLVRVAPPEEDSTDTRRRALMAEVAGLPRVARVIAGLTDARLLVTDASPSGEQTVEVAHEAVIRNWSRLRTWLVEDRQFLLWQQRTRQWLHEWIHSDREDGALLRGRILSEAESWLASKGREHIAPDLLDYVDHSCHARDRDRGKAAMSRAAFLLSARPDEVLSIIESLQPHFALIESRLETLLAEAAEGERWRVLLALASGDPSKATLLISEFCNVIPHELVIIRNALAAHKEIILERLWEKTDPAAAHSQERFRSAILLADFAPYDRRWANIASDVAKTLAHENQLHLREWVSALRPVRDMLLDPLQWHFLNEPREGVRESAAVLLIELAYDRPSFLARLASESLPQNYEQFFVRLGQSSRSLEIAQGALQSIAAERPRQGLLETERVRVGKRRAVAACTLLRMGVTTGVQDILADSEDPEALTQFIHQVKQRGLPAESLIHFLPEADTAACRYGLLLALGGYPIDQVPSNMLAGILDSVTTWYEQDPDSGVHSACFWLLQKWEMSSRLGEVDRVAKPYDPASHRNWFTIRAAESLLTFVKYEPGVFLMGSPETELERSSYESPQHEVHLTRPFAVCTREVTRGEFETFMMETGIKGLPNIDEWSPLRSEPVVAPTWYESVHFSHWLTEKVGFPEREQCYKDAAALDGSYINGLGAFDLSVAGFRLPTEAEWEYACRSGTVSPYSFGSDRLLLDQYGWSGANSSLKTHASGTLLPNRRGLFNIHCNCWEWCLDWYGPYPGYRVVDPIGERWGDRRVLRGGCWNLGARYGRSACRNAHLPTNRNYYIGMRLVCTLPLELA
ncbi:nSTAND1 domain-containing NTPase [Nonomuraea sp. NPDC001684]